MCQAVRYLPKSIFKSEKSISKTSKKINLAPPKDQGSKDLEQFLLMAKSTGAEVYIIQYWEKREITSKNSDIGNKKIRQLAGTLNIPVKQTKTLFFDAYIQELEPFRDSIHPNDLGQELLAQLMLDTLKNREQPQKQNFEPIPLISRL